MAEPPSVKPVNQDSAWSWVAATGVFLIVFLVSGTKKSLGVLLPHLQEEFVTDTWVIGLSVTLGQALGAVICKFKKCPNIN